MKTIMNFLIILLLNGTLLFAAETRTNFFHSLTPVMPKEAAFETSDGLETLMMSENMLRFLAPCTPREATFDDPAIVEISTPDLSSLAPSTPEEADFSDAEASDSIEPLLNPSTPKEADFADII
jgi:hypothetical protein